MLNKFVVNNTLWYLINSFNYTKDTGWFSVENKKLQRLLVWNILEYTVMYFLEIKNIPYKTDKSNPFLEDDWADITIDKNWIPLYIHCKWSLMKNMVWQIRNWKKLIEDLNKYNGYILIWYININLVNKIIQLVDIYLKNWGVFAKQPNIISIEEILEVINFNTNINYDNILNNNYWQNIIEIYWLITTEDYFNNSYFVWYGENIPWTNFNQFFQEWSYFLNKDFSNFIKLNDLIL